jgi:NAD(P)-dependent dehydrogenase (short-subunit alcohol dehydrogenase family)
MIDPSANQTVIVTGASRGLGEAVARILSDMGARVVLTARSEGKLEELAHTIHAAGREALSVPGDISDPATARTLVETAVEQFGKLDAIVNNAGMLEPVARIAEADADAWQQNWAVNVLGPILLTQAALPHLRERGGRVINVSSGAAVGAKPSWGAYCAAKAALNQFNATLALEEPQVTAIAVRPGRIDTEMQAVLRREGHGQMDDDDYARFVGYHERGELPAPDVPGRAVAVMALYAPREWSGEFMRWDDERVAALSDR